MKKNIVLIFSVFFVVSSVFSQSKRETQKGHTNQNKFKQLKDELATPDRRHTASGAPGKKCTQTQS
jgi:hypothetical protein